MKSLKIRSAFAAAALMGMASVAAAGSVDVYGVVDASVRHVSDKNPSASATVLNGSGLEESRIGFRFGENLGNGLKAFGQLEHRFDVDTGAQSANGANGFWSQSLIGVEHAKFGRVSVGRQFNVLHDLVSAAYPAYKFAPEGVTAHGVESLFNLGTRGDNLIKFSTNVAGVDAAVQYSPDEKNPNGGQSFGATARYTFGQFTLGAGQLSVEDGAGQKAIARTFGGTYTVGPLTLNASYAKNEFDAGFNSASIDSLGTYGSAGASTESRDALSIGGAYRVTPAITVGAQYAQVTQTAFGGAEEAKIDFTSAVVDYSLSKRTDVYTGVDFTKVKGGQERTGFLVGVRHRF